MASAVVIRRLMEDRSFIVVEVGARGGGASRFITYLFWLVNPKRTYW